MTGIQTQRHTIAQCHFSRENHLLAVRVLGLGHRSWCIFLHLQRAEPLHMEAIPKDEWEDEAATCKLCQAQLGKRHFNLRKRCQVCGASVCARCAPNRLELEGGKGAQRACVECVRQVGRLPQLRNHLVQLCEAMRKLLAQPGARDLDDTKEVEDLGPETLDAKVHYLTATLPLLEAATRAKSSEEEERSYGSLEKEMQAQQLLNIELSAELALERQLRQSLDVTEPVARREASGDVATCKTCLARLGKRYFNPRHYCRVCNACVCARCAPNRLELEGVKGAQRVCGECVQQVGRLPHLHTQLLQMCETMKKLLAQPRAKDSENMKEIETDNETLDAAVHYLTTTLPLLESAISAKILQCENGSDGSTDKEMRAQQLLNIELSFELERERQWRRSWAAAVCVADPADSGAREERVEGEWFLAPSVGTWLRQWPPHTRAAGPVPHASFVEVYCTSFFVRRGAVVLSAFRRHVVSMSSPVRSEWLSESGCQRHNRIPRGRVESQTCH